MEFVVIGNPVPKGRPKVSIINGHPVVYAPAKTRQAESNIRAQIVSQLPVGFVPFDEALVVELTFVRTKPKSTSKKVLYPITKPDIDNTIKTVLDAMDSVVFRDDSVIVHLIASKRFANEDEGPHTKIRVDTRKSVYFPGEER